MNKRFFIHNKNRYRDYVGVVFGRLTVQKLKYIKDARSYWKCFCTCGQLKVVSNKSLCSGTTKSCGCLAKENGRKQGLAATKHGEGTHGKRTRTYRIWQGILRRCNTPSASGYKNYGGRGVTVCKRWHTYINFKNDMGECPVGFSIERKNNNKGYTLSNCKWATRAEQTKNTRRTIKLKYKGTTLCLTEWAVTLGIPRTTFWRKIKKGYTVGDFIC